MDNVIHHDFNYTNQDDLVALEEFEAVASYCVLPIQQQLRLGMGILLGNLNNAKVIGFIPLLQFAEELHRGYVTPVTQMSVTGYYRQKSTNNPYLTQSCALLPIPENAVDGEILGMEERVLYRFEIFTGSEFEPNLTTNVKSDFKFITTHPLLCNDTMVHLAHNFYSIVKASGGHVQVTECNDKILLLGTFPITQGTTVHALLDFSGRVHGRDYI